MADTSQSSQDVSRVCPGLGWSHPLTRSVKEITFLVTEIKSNYVTTMAKSFKLTPPHA